LYLVITIRLRVGFPDVWVVLVRVLMALLADLTRRECRTEKWSREVTRVLKTGA
jgi:hypothetical protein